jgi:Xaa-Pro aminopeptidase
MSKACIPETEFKQRIVRIREKMERKGFEALIVYGDEYRKENLRYVSNFWPIFERGALIIGRAGEPILLCAPEGEMVAREMSAWQDVRLLREFFCVTVSDDIDYPMANYTSFKKIGEELRASGILKSIGLVGMDAMPADLLSKIEDGFGCKAEDANSILFELRKNKSKNEVECLKEAARIADAGFKALMESDIIGKTERYAAGIAEGAARCEGAEAVIFTVFGSGERSASIVGRPTEKVIEDGDMIMCALAIQYEGYVATCEAPFAVGNVSSDNQRVIDVLIRASAAGLPYLKAGVPMKNFVQAVRDCFREQGLSKYDVYPPLHGIGCAEAESPYPDENTEEVFTAGMTVNTDISLFGLPGGSNRIEEGFVITKDGAESLSPYVHEYCRKWLKNSQ